jgi:hypothetical protein
MSKTSTKKGLNRKHSAPTATDQTHSRRQAAAAALAAEAKKKVSLGSKLRKKTRKRLPPQQAAEARDTLDAEFRDLRAGVSTKYTINRHPPPPHASLSSSTVPFLFSTVMYAPTLVV